MIKLQMELTFHHLFHQGRMLHLLPSTVKKEKADPSDAGAPGSSSYKRQKDAKTKALCSKYAAWLLAYSNGSFIFWPLSPFTF